MQVRELIELLQNCDEDAEVRIMMQENWPFECAIDGLTTREQFGYGDCDCDHRIDEPHEDGCPAGDDGGWEPGLEANDVFIVEGRQERYGDKRAWAVASR